MSFLGLFKKKPADNPYDLLQPKSTDATAPAEGSVPTNSQPISAPGTVPTTPMGTVPTTQTGTGPTTQTGTGPTIQTGTGPATSMGTGPTTSMGTGPTTQTGTVPSSSKRDRKEFYYALMNALYDAILVLDANGHITDCSERVVSVLARTREELWDLPINELIPSIDAKILKQMQDGLHGKRRVLLNARCRRGDGSLFPAEIGAGLMNLIGESLVLTIRNIEKRSPVKAIIHAPARGDRPQAKAEAEGDRHQDEGGRHQAEGDRHQDEGDRPQAEAEGDRHQDEGDRPRQIHGDRPQAEGDRPRTVIGDSPRMAIFRSPLKARAAVL